MALTPKQQRFVEEYLIDLNATQAAIRAGMNLLDVSSVEGFYVYFLIDPRDGNIFYIGKGRGLRAAAHAKAVKRGVVDNAPKAERIKDIIDHGCEVTEKIFVHGQLECDAFSTERELIRGLRDHGLTNIVNGCVTNSEQIKVKAKNLLDRIVPFNIWVTDEAIMATVKSVFKQEPIVFYNHFRKTIEDLAVGAR